MKPHQKSPAYGWYRGVQKPWAFRAWAKKNPAEHARIEARFISENNACQPKSCGIVPKT
jgi:hypothetical protein